MQKLSSTKVAEVLHQVGPAMRALSEENQALKEKVAHYERRDRVTKIASVMQQKNLDPESSYEDKIETLMKPESNLDVIEQAIDLSAPQIKLAALSDQAGNAGGGADQAADTFISGILE